MDINHKRKDLNSSTIELEITIPKDSFTKSYNTILDREAKTFEIKGFRKGAVPRELVEKSLKPDVLQEVFEKIAPVYTAQAITIENIDIVAPPVYKDIEEVDVNKDITFKVDITIMPTFKIGDLKKVKVEKKEIKVEDKEIEELIEQFNKQSGTKMKTGSAKWIEMVVKQINREDIKDMDTLKAELKKLLLEQKENLIKKEVEASALKQAIELSKIEIPLNAIGYEAYEREHNFMHTLEERKIALDAFLKANDLTIEVMREMWNKDAKEALETDLFLRTYATDQKIEISDEEFKTEIENIKKGNHNAGHNYDDKQWQEYIRRVLVKEKAFRKLMEKIVK